MLLSLSRARIFVASALLTGGGALLLPSVAAAHSNAVQPAATVPATTIGVHHPECVSGTIVKDIPPGTPTPIGGIVWVKAGNDHYNVGYQPAGYVAGPQGGHAVSHVDVCPGDDPNSTTTTEAPATSAPATSAPATTPVGSVLSQVAVTPAVDRSDPAGETSGLNQTLPATGSNSVTGAVVGGMLLTLGGAALLAGRRKPNLAD